MVYQTTQVSVILPKIEATELRWFLAIMSSDKSEVATIKLETIGRFLPVMQLLDSPLQIS